MFAHNPPLLEDLKGQERAVRYLRRLADRVRDDENPSPGPTRMDGRVFMFTGPPGVGKRTAALALAWARLCPGPDAENSDFGLQFGAESQTPDDETLTGACGTCPACRKLAAGSHQDLIVLEPLEDKRTISTDQARELIKALRFAPQESEQRLVVIPDADRLTLEAANALLKTLEEPPGHTSLILTTAQPEALPGTVLSRCQRIAFRPLSRRIVSRLVAERSGLEEDLAQRAADLADGSLGRALALDPEAATARRDGLLERMAQLSRRRVAGLIDLAAEMAVDGQAAREHLADLAAWYRDAMVLAVGGGTGIGTQTLINRDKADLLTQRAGRVDAGVWMDRLATVIETEAALEANANLKLNMEALLIRLTPGLATEIK